MSVGRLWCFLGVLTATNVLAQLTSISPVNGGQRLYTQSSDRSALSVPAKSTHLGETYGQLPLSFELNQGQTDANVKFVSRGSTYTLFLCNDEFVFRMRGRDAKTNRSLATEYTHANSATPAGARSVLRMKLLGANSSAGIYGVDELVDKANYIVGNDSKKWRTSVPTYSRVKYQGIYSGIDLLYYGDQRHLEYDFVVAAHANPRQIHLRIRGAERIHIAKDGELVLNMAGEDIRWRRPIAYQENNGKRKGVEARYVVKGHDVSFEVSRYDVNNTLTIDPVLQYSTYLGGSNIDFAQAISVDSSGNAYITGFTSSVNFPIENALQPNNASADNNGNDAFVTKINATGSAFIYSTYLGGSEDDFGQSIATDSSGNAYVTGYTFSTDFPTMNALQPAFGGGGWDVFVTEISSDGSALVYSTYLGGTGQDTGYGIAVDSSGNAYITGSTSSVNFPTATAFQPANAGGTDAFVAKINATGSALVYSTYLGGGGADSGLAIAVDTSGSAYVTGSTSSTNFPTQNPLQPSFAGNGDAFVAQLNAAGSALIYSTYFGGSGADVGYGIAVDTSANAYITGYTTSADFPTLNPIQPSFGGGSWDAFVTKIESGGSALQYSTYLGGNGGEFAYSIAADTSGNAYLTGVTDSPNFPTTVNSLQSCDTEGDWDAFVTKLNASGSALIYSTCLGGSNTDGANGIAIDTSGNAYIAGHTFSSDFPTMNPLQPANGGSTDAFVAKLSPAPFVTISPTSINFGNQAVGTTSSVQSATLTNSGDAALNIVSIVANGDFSQTNTCPIGGSLAPSTSCSLSISFTPSNEGTRNGTVTITDDAVGSPQSISLTGVGLAPLVMLQPTSLNFGNQTVGITSTQQVATLTNVGNATLSIASFGITGINSSDFAAVNGCGTSVAAGGSCSITVTFTPSTTGSRTAAVTITDNASDSPQSISLTGVGVLPAVSFYPTKLTFPTQVVFTTSKPQQVTLTNTGLGILNISKVSVSGQFSQTNTCGTTVSPSGICTVSVTFTPRTSGSLTGRVGFADNAPGSPQTITLSGTGTYIQLSPTSVNFGNQPVGTTSVAKKITLSNKGSVSVSISTISVTGTNAADFAETNNCGTSIAAGGSCSIKATFTPSQTGSRKATISISDNGGGSPQQVSLSGTGTP